MGNGKQIDIAYGRGSVPIYADEGLADWTVIRPAFEAALEDAQQCFVEACEAPVGCKSLGDLISPDDRVVVVTSDGTRPVPNRLLIPWLLDVLPVRDAQVTVLLGTGTHRANTPDEIEGMFGADLMRRLVIANHDAYDAGANPNVGETGSGTPVHLDRAYLEADKRIVLGFIEPHFFAGFSGGAKGVAPGVAGIDTILRLHRAELIGHPQSTWGVLDGNPIQAEIAEAVKCCPPDFMVNVTLNAEKAITDVFAGDYRAAHLRGCEKVKASSMVSVSDPFPVVVTSNSGFPLDQNLYQTVKGMSAAARVVSEGGTILVASECSDGIPDHGDFARLMKIGDSPSDVLQNVFSEEPVLDQWQAQVLAGILERADVEVFSELSAEVVASCKLHPVDDLQVSLSKCIEVAGKGARVAVLPDGPLTIPYLSE